MHEHKRNTDEEDEIQNSFSPQLSLNINCLFVNSHKILNISRFHIKTFRHDSIRNYNYADIFKIFTEIQIDSRRIERVGRSKLIKKNLTEPDIELFMNLIH